MDCSTSGLPVHHKQPELAQTHVHQVGDTIHPTISSYVLSLSCPQSFPASGPFPVSRLLASGGQSIRASVLASVLPMNIHSELNSFRIDWFDLLLSKGLSRVFSNTTIQKHQFFGTQLSLWSNSHIHTRLLTNAFSIVGATPSNF